METLSIADLKAIMEVADILRDINVGSAIDSEEEWDIKLEVRRRYDKLKKSALSELEKRLISLHP